MATPSWPRPGLPRLLGKVISGVGRLVGYPTGKDLAASLR
jgi:hypothetical protein